MKNSPTSYSAVETGRAEAQSRIDRILAFRSELEAVTGEGVLSLDPADRHRVDAFHDRLIDELQTRFDVDVDHSQKRLSLGMRIASLIGALALSAAVFFFFYQIWGLLVTPVQVVVLIAVPLAATLAAGFLAGRERTLYLTSLMALVALSCFVVNITMLGQIFNITPSQSAFLVWGLFALMLAYAWGLKLILTAGLVCMIGYFAATIGVWGGLYWLSFGERPETVLIGGLLIAGAGFYPHRVRPEFAAVFRNFGLLVALIAVLILAHWGRASYALFAPSNIEAFYQVLGFAGSAMVIWLGIRRNDNGLFNLGSTFFVLFLYTKVFDWWWDWMPKWLFFLVVGVIAVVLLLMMYKLRATGNEAQA